MGNEKSISGYLACVCLLAIWVAPANADPVSPRVRVISASLSDSLSRGRRHSPTLATLVAALERSDVIVHIEARWFRLNRVVAETRFVAKAGQQRYVRISIDARVREDAAIALIGHELQHAWEIAQAPWVTDENDLAELYSRIGHPAGGGYTAFSSFDTDAGPEVERRVRIELARRSLLREILPGAD